ncbi:MAG: heme lyase CcmF/NrfE family subunit [Chloroflexi bacterium]|nr:heme lyase CcmF/NrfE family subunit [Chloroflexota bacterium]MCL5107559.1 heme lyase CcmF/NrfE family subunit [Chloroflexota bacterium]
MVDVGRAALALALIIAVFGGAAPVLGARSGFPELLVAGRRAVYVVGALVSVAGLLLLYAFLTHDFILQYVAQYSARDMALIYTISAFWAGQEGSLLLWAWVLALFASLVAWQNRRRHPDLMPYVQAVLMVNQTFILGVLVLLSDPFAKLQFTPADGQGLNPLLENMGMFFHPTTLYLGYVGFTVPFAFAMAALIKGKLGDEWIRSTRRWTLVAWFFLTLGNLFGAQWAYVELGWGGYWAWDPVESASFMPWLVGTAYLHSVMVQQRRGMLKVWNIALIIATYSLVLFGTFLTRSGVLASVHTFGQSGLGPFFLAFIGLTLAVSLGLLIDRLPLLRSEHELDSFLSRESSFLFNNLILVGAAFATFWGTVFPLISEAVRGVKITVGAPFFNQVNGPIFLALIALMGICPLISWRKASPDNLARNFLYPLAGTLVLVALLFIAGVREFYALLAFGACTLVATTLLLEFFRGVRARGRIYGENPPRALPRLIWHNKPRYGGYIVHLGVILIAVGVAGSSLFQAVGEANLKPGESLQLRQYTLINRGVAEYPTATRRVVAASVDVVKDGKVVDTLSPAKLFHPNYENPVSEVAIRTTPQEDLYVILAGWADDYSSATFKAYVNPLIVWLWIGGVVLLLGTAIAVWPDRREVRQSVSARQTVPTVTSGLAGVTR